MNRFILTAIHLGLASTLAACSPPPPQAPVGADLPDAGPDGVYKVEFPETADPETRALLMTVSEDVTRQCREDAEPNFHFDESTPRPQAMIKLAFITQCLKSPRLEDKQVFLVGHADRRGTEAYNLELALERARKIKQALIDQGVDADRLQLGTMGESAAVGGEDKAFSHGYDRRVDIMVLGKTASPIASGVTPYIPVDADAPEG